jgi:glycosyltransferase involved in cell wall biosynthesis
MKEQTITSWPMISVVTPSYNQGAFIEKTIQSVLDQDYPNFEHIVIDGGSTDGTIEILYRFPYLNWISEKDSGQSQALNKGFRKAKGEIIAWINSDDWYEPGAFLAVAEFFLQHPEKAVVMGDCQLVDAQGIPFRIVVNKERKREDILKFWLPYSIPTQPSVFFRKELLDKFGLLDETLHFAMDYDLWMRFAASSAFPHIDRVLSDYRFHPGAKGGDQDWNKFVPECRQVFRRYAGKNIWVWLQYLWAEMLSKLKWFYRSLRSLINHTFASHA